MNLSRYSFVHYSHVSLSHNWSLDRGVFIYRASLSTAKIGFELNEIMDTRFLFMLKMEILPYSFIDAINRREEPRSFANYVSQPKQKKKKSLQLGSSHESSS